MKNNKKNKQSIWIEGPTQTGKTTRLTKLFSLWVNQQFKKQNSEQEKLKPVTPSTLILAGNDDNKKVLNDQLSQSVKGSYPVVCKTPLGFFSDEVILFFPLISAQLNLKTEFPLRLRPETEQDLATRLWRDQLDEDDIALFGNEYRFVRRTLDLLQLAGASGIPTEKISDILEKGKVLTTVQNTPNITHNSLTQKIGKLLIQWRDYCLERGLLSYGLIYELYWQYLLPNTGYQEHLFKRYYALFADNIDDYPAIAKDLFDILLDQGVYGVFTYNPDGQIRKGLNADPDYLITLAEKCKIEYLSPKDFLGKDLTDIIIPCLTENNVIPQLSESIQSIQTVSRAELLRQTTDFIIHLVKNEKVNPADIAIIAPGLDEIARYSFLEIFSAHNLPIEPLNEQRPLISSALIRALLTLLCLIYPNLGRLADRDGVAEMLVILSQKPVNAEDQNRRLAPEIDPVRAGLLSEYCYYSDENNPHLLPYENYTRWDRLGYHATMAYSDICFKIEKLKNLVKQGENVSPLVLLDQAIEDFFAQGNILPFDQLSALRELMETAQHFWEVDLRLRHHGDILADETATIAQFIYLLRRGTITANPRPIKLFGHKKSVITLANIFQYRSLRSRHKYQFWLDTGSILWSKGGASDLFGAQFFLRNRLGKPFTTNEENQEDQARLQRILRDLLGRVETKVYLCHSDLGVTGTEQNGALLILVHGATLVNFN